MQTPITPTSYGPLGLANLLTIRGVGPINDSGCPNYVYDIADKQLVSPAVPAIPAVPATEDEAEVPEVPAVPAVYSTRSITNGNKAMEPAQWANWPTGPSGNEDYQLTCIAANLNLTRA